MYIVQYAYNLGLFTWINFGVICVVPDDGMYMIMIDYNGLTRNLEFNFQISDGISEKISVVGFITLSVFHQYLNNFFGEFIIQKVNYTFVKLSLWIILRKRINLNNVFGICMIVHSNWVLAQRCTTYRGGVQTKKIVS